MKINIEAFWDEVRAGNIRYQKHPEADLLIWNYTQVATFRNHWNENTLLARGLITTEDGTIHARSYRKFFNLNQAPGPSLSELPDETPVITRKEDGFLGISYWNPTTKTVRSLSSWPTHWRCGPRARRHPARSRNRSRRRRERRRR